MREFDVVVIGAGVAGEVAAGRLGENGLSVAIVEDRLVGGECSFYACMPSKALLRPVELAREVARVPGLEIGPIDVAAVLERRDDVIAHLDDTGQVPWLEAAWSHARPWTWPTRRGASRRCRRRGAGGAPGRGRGYRLVGSRSGHPGAPRSQSVDEHRGDDRVGGTVALRDSRRRRRRSRDGPGVGSTRVARDTRAPRRPTDRARGAVRLGTGSRGSRGRRCGRSAAAIRGTCLAIGAGRDRAGRRLDDRRQTRCSSPSAALPARRGSGSRRSELDRRRPARCYRRDARSRARLVVRGRRCQRSRTAHAHGEVPGPPGRRRDARSRGAASLRRGTIAARDLHRPPGRGRRPHPRRARGRRGFASGTSTSRRAATRAARSSVAVQRGRRGSSSTRTDASSSVPRSRAPRSRRRSTPRRSRSSRRCRSTISGTPCRRFRRGASCG